MADVFAFVLTSLAFYVAVASATRSKTKVRSPKYEGPAQGITKGEQWDYHDHGVSWDMGKCNSGIKQSPIELPTEIKNNSQAFYYRYKPIEHQVELFNDGYMFSITTDPCTGGFGIGEKTIIDGQPLDVQSKYALALVVFHSPSEHTWSGEHLPLEVQLIHRKSDDPESQGIVSIGFHHAMDEIVENPFLAALLEKVPTVEERDSTEVNKFPEHSLDFGALIGESNMWTYEGSMTVPSCKSNAKWFVRQQYIEAPEPQIKQFTEAIMRMTSQTGNNRVIQPLGDRQVTLMASVDATTLETVEEKEQRAEKRAAFATVKAPKDPDDEDAVQSASTVHVDPITDEGFRKKLEKLGEFEIKTPETILNTFGRTTILNYPDRIKESDQELVEAKNQVLHITEERDNAAQVQGSACEFTEETATPAKINSCNMAKGVVQEQELQLEAAQKILDQRAVHVETQIRDAQKEVEKQIERENKQASAGGDEKTMESVPHDIHQVTVAVPQGDVNDPFSMDCAETISRIDATHPMVAEQITPNLDQSAEVPGIHFTESDASDPDVMAPADGDDDDAPTDDEATLFLQVRKGGRKRKLKIVKYV